MSFDYFHTCPDIDGGILGFEETVYDQLKDMIDECCPLLQGEIKDRFIKSYTADISQSFIDYAEKVRSTNIDMRKEAERQIQKLEDDIADYEYDVRQLNNQIEELNREIDSFQ